MRCEHDRRRSADHQPAATSVVDAQTDPVLEAPNQIRKMKDTNKPEIKTKSITFNYEFCCDKDYTENTMDRNSHVHELLVEPDDENDWKNDDVVNIEKNIKEDEIM